MRQFIIEILVTLIVLVLLGCIFCIPGYGQDWQDEEHVWNAERGEWEVRNRAVVPAAQTNQNVAIPIYTQEWARYLPSTVRQGRRQATPREISEAQRKLWAKEIITARAMLRSQQRRELMAYRRATGWHYKRSQNAFAPGPALRYHMNTSGYGY